MNNNRSHLSASRTGGGASLLRRINEKQAGNETNDTSSASATNEGIVQNIQGFLLQIRRDRDRNHRLRDIALEKLRSAKEIYKTEKSNFQAEKEKLAKTQKEAETAQQEIMQNEKIIEELQQKYQFQHEDLLRKRQKIQHQEQSLESTAAKRNESMIDVRKRLDRQRNKYQEIKQAEEKESETLLSTILSLAIREANGTGASAVANDDEKPKCVTETIAKTTNESAEMDKTDGKSADQEFQLHASSLDQFLDELEGKKEAALANEFKTNIDYDMLPEMISRKAQNLQIESENMIAEIARLETLLYGETKVQEEWKDPQSDGETIAGSESQFEADLCNGIGEAEFTPDKALQIQGQQPNTGGFLNSEIAFETDTDGVGTMQTYDAQFDATEHGAGKTTEQGHDSDVDTIIGSDTNFDEGMDFGNGLEEKGSGISESRQEQGYQSNAEPMLGGPTQLEALLRVAAKARDSSEAQYNDRTLVDSKMYAERGMGNSIDTFNPTESALSTATAMDTN